MKILKFITIILIFSIGPISVPNAQAQVRPAWRPTYLAGSTMQSAMQCANLRS